MLTVSCSPDWPLWNPKAMITPITSVTTAPAVANQPTSRFGRKRPTTPNARGSQRSALIMTVG